VRRHQEPAGDGERDDAHDDEEERGDPFGRQARRDAGPVPPVDGLALPHQAHGQRTCVDTKQNNRCEMALKTPRLEGSGLDKTPNHKPAHNKASKNHLDTGKMQHYGKWIAFI